MGSKIKQVQREVEIMLRLDPYTRDSDEKLYMKMCQEANPIAVTMQFSTVWLHRKDLGLPDFNTVARCRRRLQAKYSELRPNKEVEEFRYENFKEFVEYAQGEV